MLDGDLKETPSTFLGGKSPRLAMQTLGTEWRDTINRNLWVDVWKRYVQNFPSDAKILVDDLRFAHEATAVRELGGKIVRIRRPNAQNPGWTNINHISEVESLTLPVDGEIRNDSTPDAMLDQLAAIIMEYWK